MTATELDDACRRATELLDKAVQVALLTHERPDGDALGCVIAWSRFLTALGKQPHPYLFDQPSERYNRLLDRMSLSLWNDQSENEIRSSCSAIIISDTCALSQLTPARQLLSACSLPIIVVDHHLSAEPLATCAVIDPTASAACLLLLEWAERMNWPVDRATAEALFSGIATDTGWFRFDNTDARTLSAAARLLAHGLQPAELYEAYYLNDRFARLRLLSKLGETAELHADSRLISSVLTRQMLAQAGAAEQDCDDLVNELMRIGDVEVAAFFVEKPAQLIKVSLRSKRAVNVADVAAQFGGGGHARAAGMRVAGSVQDVRTRVLDALTLQLVRGSSS